MHHQAARLQAHAYGAAGRSVSDGVGNDVGGRLAEQPTGQANRALLRQLQPKLHLMGCCNQLIGLADFRQKLGQV